MYSTVVWAPWDSWRGTYLWKPLLALALFFDSKAPEPKITAKLIDFALERIRQKVIENVTQTGEMILASTLLHLTQQEDWSDGFHKVSKIRGAMANAYDEDQKWLSNEWTGRALNRLGFKEKRRLGTGIEVVLKEVVVQDLADRLVLSEGNEGNEGSEPTENKDNLTLDSIHSQPPQPTQLTLN